MHSAAWWKKIPQRGKFFCPFQQKSVYPWQLASFVFICSYLWFVVFVFLRVLFVAFFFSREAPEIAAASRSPAQALLLGRVFESRGQFRGVGKDKGQPLRDAIVFYRFTGVEGQNKTGLAIERTEMDPDIDPDPPLRTYFFWILSKVHVFATPHVQDTVWCWQPLWQRRIFCGICFGKVCWHTHALTASSWNFLECFSPLTRMGEGTVVRKDMVWKFQQGQFTPPSPKEQFFSQKISRFLFMSPFLAVVLSCDHQLRMEFGHCSGANNFHQWVFPPTSSSPSPFPPIAVLCFSESQSPEDIPQDKVCVPVI